MLLNHGFRPFGLVSFDEDLGCLAVALAIGIAVPAAAAEGAKAKFSSALLLFEREVRVVLNGILAAKCKRNTKRNSKWGFWARFCKAKKN